MTIAISLKVNDGMVLAADSASTLVGRDPTTEQSIVVNVYNTANKVFNLRKGLPIGLITWGAGSIGTASISTLAKDLRRRLTDGEWKLDPASYSIEEVAGRVRQFFFNDLYSPTFADWPQKPSLGFVVAGYSANEPMAEEYSILMEGECSPPTLLRPRAETGMTWNGQPEAITRLVLGFSYQTKEVLATKVGMPTAEADRVIQILKENLQAPLVEAAMPIQDAIDLAVFLTEVSTQFSRFLPGAQTVGGPVEVAAITKHEGFKWIRRKYYYSRDINPEEAK